MILKEISLYKGYLEKDHYEILCSVKDQEILHLGVFKNFNDENDETNEYSVLKEKRWQIY